MNKNTIKLQKISLSLLLLASPLLCRANNIAESVFAIANGGTESSVGYLSFNLHQDSLIDIATSGPTSDSVIYLLDGDSDFSLNDFLAASDDGCLPIDCGSSLLFNNALIDNKALPAGDYTVALSTWPFEPEEAISGLNPDNITAGEILVVVGDEDLVIPGTGAGTGSQLLQGFNSSSGNANDIATAVAVNQACKSASEGELHDACLELVNVTEEQLPIVLGALSPSKNSTVISGLAVETAQPTSTSVQVRMSGFQVGGAQHYGGLSVNGFGDEFGGRLAAGDEMPSIFKRWGFFINGTGNFGSKNAGTNESGYDYQAGGITIGTDYAVTDSFLLGAAFDYERNDVTLQAQGGNMQTDSYTGSLYSTFNINDFYVDGIFSIGGNKYQTERNIIYTTITDTFNDVAKGSNDGMRYEVNINGGYVFTIDELMITPYVGFDYSHTSIQAYDETEGGAWAVHYDHQGVESIESTLGVRSSYAMSTDIGVFIPQISAEWGHEFSNNQQIQTARFIQDTSGSVIYLFSDKPDRDYMRVGFDVSGHFSNDISAFFSYQALVLMADVNSHIVTGGIRMQF